MLQLLLPRGTVSNRLGESRRSIQREVGNR
jgi:hypothetical protein